MLLRWWRTRRCKMRWDRYKIRPNNSRRLNNREFIGRGVEPDNIPVLAATFEYPCPAYSYPQKGQGLL